jgi:carboxylesterase type B
LKQNPGAQAKLYAKQVNCPTSSTKEMVACLKRLPISDLLDAHSETNVSQWIQYKFSLFSTVPCLYILQNAFRPRDALFAPTVEIIQEGAFLPAHPYDLIRSGKVNAVPWMSGYNADEGLIFLGSKALCIYYIMTEVGGSGSKTCHFDYAAMLTVHMMLVEWGQKWDFL